MLTWETIRRNLAALLGVDEDIIEYQSAEPYLLAYVGGLSLADMQRVFSVSREEILEVILNFFPDAKFFDRVSPSPLYVYRKLLRSGAFPKIEDFRLFYEDKEVADYFFEKVTQFLTLRYRILSKYRRQDYENYLKRSTRNFPGRV